MTLREKQSKFAGMLGRLLVKAEEIESPLVILCMYRGLSEQQVMVSTGKSKTLESKHLMGLAVDVAFLEDIMEDGMLPNDDPKLLIARKNLDEPIDINKASYKELLRIPGIGKISARKIIRNKIQGYKDLQKNRIIKRAIPFISINNVYQKTLI